MNQVKLLYGVDVIDGLKTLESESVHCVVTSPAYWVASCKCQKLENFGTGTKWTRKNEKTDEEFIKNAPEGIKSTIHLKSKIKEEK